MRNIFKRLYTSVPLKVNPSKNRDKIKPGRANSEPPSFTAMEEGGEDGVLPNLECKKAANGTSSSCSPPQYQVILFFFSLYLVAFAQGGHKPCVQAFGADQFDSSDPEECKSKSSFFNWWYFGLCGGTVVSLSVLTYIQDNLGWGLGFGIPCIVMGFALVIFLLGTTTYRFTVKGDDKSPFVRIGQVFVTAARNWRTPLSAISLEEEARGTLPDSEHSTCSAAFSPPLDVPQDAERWWSPGRFLNKALLSPDGLKENDKVCGISQVNEAKAVLRLVPIWATCLGYAIVFAQSPTLFTKQGVTMDRSLGLTFEIPAASLQVFISLSIVILMPIYDRIFVPITRAITHKPSGITMLQRIGTGMVLSILSMAIAALTETKRLETALASGLVNDPEVTLPMSVWWLVPQYVLFGVSDVFTMVGLQEFFYDQVPIELKSLGLALYLSIFGVGSFLSSFLISIIDNTTGASGQDGWFSDNLNKGHLDYFYWLLAGISAVALVAYLLFTRSYIYNRGNMA
ncbi:hypothetical protein LguiB_018214 [Lonicera macranthoides]